MFKAIKQWFKRHIDYRIVGAYLDTDKNGHGVVKYHKKYYFKK